MQTGPQGEWFLVRNEFPSLTEAADLQSLTQQVLESSQSTGILKEYQLRYYRAVTPFGIGVVFADISMERQVLEHLVGICALIGAVSMAVFLGLSILFASWAVKPVAQAWEQQRQFIADASHELKTPLTVILTNAELLQNGVSGTAASENILAMSRQMRSLVEQMLDLARVDNGTTQMTMQWLNLSELVMDAVLPFEALLFERDLSLQLEVQEDLGSEYQNYDLVMAGPFGLPMEASRINHRFHELIREHDLPKVVFHSLRHSSITYKLKLNGGDVKSVQGDSGHAQAKMVTDQYSHILDEDRRLNAQRFEEAFYSGKKTAGKEDTPDAAPESDQQDDMATLTKLLANPETAGLLKALVKAMEKEE